MSTRQYLHGSMESAGDTVHVLFGDVRETAVADTLAEAGHQVILVTTADLESRRTWPLSGCRSGPAAQRAILEVLVMQILVAAVADAAGHRHRGVRLPPLRHQGLCRPLSAAAQQHSRTGRGVTPRPVRS